MDEFSDAKIDDRTRQHLLRRYGKRAPALIARVLAEPELARTLHETRPEITLEIDHAVEHEWARSISDFMWRRTFLAFTPDLGTSCLDVVTARMAALLGWSGAEVKAQRERYQREVERAVAPIRAAAEAAG
jgi:glycerol-3-phosphate dehydrogenase